MIIQNNADPNISTQMFTPLDFRQHDRILAIVISTISKNYQNPSSRLQPHAVPRVPGRQA